MSRCNYSRWLFALCFLVCSVQAQFDLEVGITSDPETPIAGENFTLKVTINNKGTLPAAGVNLTNHFPATMAVKSYTGEWLEVRQDDRTFSFQLGDIQASEVRVIDFLVEAGEGEQVITATALAAEPEAVVFDNHFTIQVEVAPTLNFRPSVAITSTGIPFEIPFGSEIEIKAEAFDLDGTIAKVNFVVNNSTIYEDFAPPYQAAWRAQTYGLHEISATAYDNLGAFGSSEKIIVLVAPPERTKIVSFNYSSAEFELVAGAEAGRTSRLFSSDDLLNWEQVDSKVADGPLVTFKGSGSNRPGRFYRVAD